MASKPLVTRMLPLGDEVGFKTVLLTGIGTGKPNAKNRTLRVTVQHFTGDAITKEVLTSGSRESKRNPYSKAEKKLDGRHLRVRGPKISPYTIHQKTKDPVTGEESVAVHGTDPGILDMLAAEFGFTYDLAPANYFDVYTLPNGTKIGAVYWVRKSSWDTWNKSQIPLGNCPT